MSSSIQSETAYHLDDETLRERLDALRPIPRISIQAFCETPEVSSVLEASGADRRMSKAHLRVHTGGIRAAAEHYASAPTPNLVILESQLAPAELLAELDTLAEVCDPGSKVVIVGHCNDVSLYRELTRRGISEYVLAPLSLSEFIGSSRSSSPPRTRPRSGARSASSAPKAVSVPPPCRTTSPG